MDSSGGGGFGALFVDSFSSRVIVVFYRLLSRAGPSGVYSVRSLLRTRGWFLAI